jgi:hypothetical protein
MYSKRDGFPNTINNIVFLTFKNPFMKNKPIDQMSVDELKQKFLYHEGMTEKVGKLFNAELKNGSIIIQKTDLSSKIVLFDCTEPDENATIKECLQLLTQYHTAQRLLYQKKLTEKLHPAVI